MTRIGSIGECKLIDWDVRASFYVSLALLKIRGASAEYIAQYSNSVAFKKEIELHSLQHATPKKINLGQISDVKISLPPTDTEQQIIAGALTDADALLATLEKAIAKNRDIRQGTMQQLLTGKHRLTGFSGEWSTKVLGELFSFSGGVAASRDQLGWEGYCYLHYGDIHMSRKSHIDLRLEQSTLPKLDIPLKKVPSGALLSDGDVVFVDASEDDEGTSKHIVVENPDRVPFVSGLHTIVAKSKTTELAHAYRRYCFLAAEIRAQFRFYAAGTKVMGVSKSNVAKILLRFPSASEQIAIASVLSDMDAEIAALEKKRDKTRALKQGMMQELLTGRIRLV